MKEKGLGSLLGIFLPLLLVLALVAACAPAPAPTQTPAATTAPTATPKSSATSAPAKAKSVKLLGATAGSETQLFFDILSALSTQDMGIPVVALLGGVEKNLPMLLSGDGDITYGTGDTVYDAYNGVGTWQGKKPITNLRFMMNMVKAIAQAFFVRASSNINKMEDLKNKRIALGTKGGGAEIYGTRYLKAYGITAETVAAAGGVINYVSYAQMQDGLADKSFDAIFFSGVPWAKAPTVLPVEQGEGVRLIGPTGDVMNKILKDYPYLQVFEADGGMYKNHPQPVPLIGYTSAMYVRSDMEEGLVYKLMTSFNKPENAKQVRERTTNMIHFGSKETILLGSNIIPMHKEAAKWFRDNGITLPSNIEVK